MNTNASSRCGADNVVMAQVQNNGIEPFRLTWWMRAI